MPFCNQHCAQLLAAITALLHAMCSCCCIAGELRLAAETADLRQAMVCAQAAFADADSTAMALQSAAPTPVVHYHISKLQL